MISERAKRLCRQGPPPQRQSRKQLLIGSPSSLPFEKANGGGFLNRTSLWISTSLRPEKRCSRKKDVAIFPAYLKQRGVPRPLLGISQPLSIICSARKCGSSLLLSLAPLGVPITEHRVEATGMAGIAVLQGIVDSIPRSQHLGDLMALRLPVLLSDWGTAVLPAPVQWDKHARHAGGDQCYSHLEPISKEHPLP